jgi:hypothetical protein
MRAWFVMEFKLRSRCFLSSQLWLPDAVNEQRELTRFALELGHSRSHAFCAHVQVKGLGVWIGFDFKRGESQFLRLPDRVFEQSATEAATHRVRQNPKVIEVRSRLYGQRIKSDGAVIVDR